MKKIYNRFLLICICFFIWGVSIGYAQQINPRHKAYIKEKYGIEYPQEERLVDNSTQTVMKNSNIPILDDAHLGQVYGFNGDSFTIHDIQDPCGSLENGTECTCYSQYPQFPTGKTIYIDFKILEPMDIMITNILPQTRIYGNSIHLYGPSGEVFPTVDCFMYYDYNKLRAMTNETGMIFDYLNSIFVRDLFPGEYTLAIRGLKMTNGGTGYGRVETLIVGTSKKTIGGLLPELTNIKIPVEQGLHFSQAINAGNYIQNFSYAHKVKDLKEYLGFYNLNEPFFYSIYPQEEYFLWMDRLSEYMMSYKPNEGKNVVYEFKLEKKPQEISISSDSKLFLLNQDKKLIKEGDKNLEMSLPPGKYYVVTSCTENNSSITIEGVSFDPHDKVVYSQNENYILSRTITSDGGRFFVDQIQYFDGLGRPMEKMQVQASPKKADWVTYQEYDAFGRESNSWLPVAISGNNGAYADLSKVKSNMNASYPNDVNPFSKPIYEASPLNRVVEQYGSGADWHNKGKSVKTFYLTNKGGGVVQKSITMDGKDTQEGILSGAYPSCESITLKPGFQFKSTEEKSLHLYTDPSLCQAPKAMPMAASTASMPALRDEFLICTNYTIKNEQLTKSNSYNVGELYVTLMLDEDDNQSLEFKDKLGQVVLTRQINGSEKYDTYYVYDDFGNLRYVLPPLAVDKLTNHLDGDAIMKQYAYIYKYDSRNRCISKKLPGVEPILFVYDKADRLIFSQDGEQRAKKEWAFSISDAFGRPTVAGTCKSIKIGSSTAETAIASGCLDNILVQANWAKTTNTFKGYTITNITPTSPVVMSANYYDSYEFMGLNGIPAITDGNLKPETLAGYRVQYTGGYKTLLTGVLTAQMTTASVGNYLYSVMYYDNRGRVIQTKSNNHLTGGIEKEYIAYNFVGQPTQKLHVHSATGKTTQTELYTYSYDHAGRLIDTKHKLNAGAETLIAHNEYDELGRLKSNKKGNNASLATTYAYNIRSWTTSMESTPLSIKLDYTPSGNISSQAWVQDINKKGKKERKYTFEYDGLSRLKEAIYISAVNGEAYGTSYKYDKHGNIMTLNRNGKTTASYGAVDNLTMTYVGNQLTKVRDEVKGVSLSESADFQNFAGDNGLMTYNRNGALASDSHKGITSIQYNFLNLPTSITVGGVGVPVSGNIQYTYSASGVKLQTIHTENNDLQNVPMMSISAFGTADATVTKTDYVGNKVYENDKLKRILIDGGYYDALKKKYFYYLTDHLGNNRVVAEANGTIVQQTQYYPFGMAFADHEGEEEQPYKYNNKELDKRLRLNTYDYSARHLSLEVPRFTSIDPLAEKYYSISPYVYVMNNPLKFIDKDGKQVGWPINPGATRANAYNQVGQQAQLPAATSYKLRVTTPIFSTTLFGVVTAHKGIDKGTTKVLSDGGGAIGTDLSISLEVENTYSTDSDSFELNDLKGESKGENLGIGYGNIGKSTATVEKEDGKVSELNSFSVGIGISPPIGKAMKGLGKVGQVAGKVFDNISIELEDVFTKFWKVKKEEDEKK